MEKARALSRQFSTWRGIQRANRPRDGPTPKIESTHSTSNRSTKIARKTSTPTTYAGGPCSRASQRGSFKACRKAWHSPQPSETGQVHIGGVETLVDRLANRKNQTSRPNGAEKGEFANRRGKDAGILET